MRRAIARFGGCLSLLPARQRRVLRLRAGVGPAEPASRARVARKLDLRVSAVRRAERRGLRALERAGRGGCASVTAADGAPAAGTVATLLATGAGSAGDAGSPPGDDRAVRTRSEGNAAGGSDGGANGRDGAAGGVKGIDAAGAAQTPAGADVTLPLLLGIVLALGGGAWLARRWLHGARV